MIKKISLLILIVSVVSYSFQIRTQYLSPFEKTMIERLSHDSLQNPFSMIQCMLIAEGETDSIAIESIKSKVDKQLEKLGPSITNESNVREKSKVIFSFLHKNIFKEYVKNSLVAGLIENGYYNNATASAMFYDACQMYKIPINLNYTTIHTYFSLVESNDTIRIEICDPHGFDASSTEEDFKSLFVHYNNLDQQIFTLPEFRRIYSEYLHFLPAKPSQIVAFRYYLDGIAFNQEKEPSRAFLAFEKSLILRPLSKAGQESYEQSFITFSNDENSAKEKYYPLFERFLINIGFNKEIILSNSSRLERYAYYMKELRDFQRCNQFLEIVMSIYSKNQEISKMISVVAAKNNFQWAYNYFDVGDYKNASLRIKNALVLDSTNQKYIETSLKITTRYTTSLIEQGESRLAKHILDSLVDQYISYPFIKESYSKSMVNIVQSENMLRDNPEEAIRILKRANIFDSKNKSIINLLANAYHNSALKKMKIQNYKIAKEIVNEGLKFSPTDSYLKADLKYLNTK